MFKHPDSHLFFFLRNVLQNMPNLYSKMPHANNLDLWPLLFFVCFFCFPQGKRIHATGTRSVNVTIIIRAEAGKILAIITSAMCRMLPCELFVAPEGLCFPSKLDGKTLVLNTQHALVVLHKELKLKLT